MKKGIVIGATALIAGAIGFLWGMNAENENIDPRMTHKPPKKKTNEELAAEHMAEHKLLEDVYGNIKPKDKFF